MNKKSFVLHCDSLSILDKLTDEQCGKLLKKMKSYHNGNSYDANDFVVEVAFEQFKNQFDRDLEKYVSVCERNSLNGSKGGRPKGETQRNPKNPSGFSETQRNPKKPKKADSDSDSDSDKNKDNLSLDNNEPIDIIRKLYPHITGRSNKKKSSVKLQKLLEDFTLDTIKREIQLLKLNIEIGKQNPSFVPGLQVWLNNFSVTLPNIYIKTISLYRQLHKEDPKKEELYKRWIDNYPEQWKLGTEEFRKSQSINLSSFR